jgi:hypothetical protein
LIGVLFAEDFFEKNSGAKITLFPKKEKSLKNESFMKPVGG